MEFTVNQVALMLNGTVEGDGNQKVFTVAKIQDGTTGAISFLANLKYEEYLYTTQSSAVIVNTDFVPKKEVKAALIKVKDAYSAFGNLLEQYKQLLTFSKKGIDHNAHISNSAQLGADLYIGASAFIGDNVSIGDNCKIYPQVYIGDNVTIGHSTILYPGVKIYDHCKIGNHCTLQANVVVGSDGFGFAPQPDGSYKTVPQIGNVVIEDHVDIGANSTIDCATMGSTIIKRGVKLDNLIQIAHNVIIGEHTVIAAQTGISGSTEIGPFSMIAGQVGIAGHIKLAEGTKIAAQSGIAKSISEPKKNWMGSPAIELTDHLRSFSIVKKLPELWKQLRQLKEEVEALKK